MIWTNPRQHLAEPRLSPAYRTGLCRSVCTQEGCRYRVLEHFVQGVAAEQGISRLAAKLIARRPRGIILRSKHLMSNARSFVREFLVIAIVGGTSSKEVN